MTSITTHTTWTQYKQARKEFIAINKPTIQQCLKYLRVKTTYFNESDLIATNVLVGNTDLTQDYYVPKEHRAFCRTQLKLEGLL